MGRPICIVLAAVAITGCATSTTSLQQPESPTADTRAVELGCPYTEPVDAARADYKVGLQYRVLADGSVDESSIVVRPSPHNTDLQHYVQRARDVARGCTYEPATADGVPVASVVRKRFYFNGDPL